jgi:hypothetical protein
MQKYCGNSNHAQARITMQEINTEHTRGAHGNTIRTSETWELTRGGLQPSDGTRTASG